MLRLFGFLFLVVLVLAGVGYVRGWYSFGTVEAGGKTGVTVEIDRDKIGKDTAAAADKLAALSAEAAEKIRGLATKSADGTSTVEGSVVAVDVAGRSVRLDAGDAAVDLRVPAGAAIVRDGADVTLADLETGTRVRVTVGQQDSSLRVERIEVLP